MHVTALQVARCSKVSEAEYVSRHQPAIMEAHCNGMKQTTTIHSDCIGRRQTACSAPLQVLSTCPTRCQFYCMAMFLPIQVSLKLDEQCSFSTHHSSSLGIGWCLALDPRSATCPRLSCCLHAPKEAAPSAGQLWTGCSRQCLFRRAHLEAGGLCACSDRPCRRGAARLPERPCAASERPYRMHSQAGCP